MAPPSKTADQSCRRQIELAILCVACVVVMLGFFVIAAMVVKLEPQYQDKPFRYVVGKVAADSLNAGIVIDVVWLVIFLFVALIVHVRRWHDLGFSGWMSLTANMPYMGLIISVAILGFVKGAEGPNIYGEDPVFRRCRPGPQPLVS